MGRQSIGNTNVKFSQLYSQCWRALQESGNPYTRVTTYLSYTYPLNLSLCKFAQFKKSANVGSVYPWVNGALKQETNLGVGSLPLNNYLYFQTFKFAGTANGSMTLTWPNSSDFDYSNAYVTSNVDNGEVGFPYQFFEDATSYFTISYVANLGYELIGYYTAKLGGTLITSSTSYNFTYNGSSAGASSQGRWWCRTQATPSSLTSFLVGPSSTNQFTVCNTLSSTTTYYHDGSGTYPAQGDIVYSDSAGNNPVNGGSGTLWPVFPSGPFSPDGWFRILGSTGTVQYATTCP